MCRHGGSGEGYDSGDDTWEPLVNLGNAEAAIAAYEHAVLLANSTRGSWSVSAKLKILKKQQEPLKQQELEKLKKQQLRTRVGFHTLGKMAHYRKKERKKGKRHTHRRVAPGVVGVGFVGVGGAWSEPHCREDEERTQDEQDKEEEEEEEEADDELTIRAAAAVRDLSRTAARKRRARQTKKRNKKKKKGEGRRARTSPSTLRTSSTTAGRQYG